MLQRRAEARGRNFATADMLWCYVQFIAGAHHMGCDVRLSLRRIDISYNYLPDHPISTPSLHSISYQSLEAPFPTTGDLYFLCSGYVMIFTPDKFSTSLLRHQTIASPSVLVCKIRRHHTTHTHPKKEKATEGQNKRFPDLHSSTTTSKITLTRRTHDTLSSPPPHYSAFG